MKRTPIRPSLRPIKPKNAKRRKANHERAYGGKERIAWVKAQPCVACGLVGYSENAHIKTGGMGRKSDARFVIPLCGPRRNVGGVKLWPGCHRSLHVLGRTMFEFWRLIDLEAKAAETEAAWQAHVARSRGADTRED